MATIKESAQAYEGQSTRNIADLPKVRTDLQLQEMEGTDNEGKTFVYQVISVDGNNYRVPKSVLKSLKVIIQENPNLKEFKVTKTGKDMQTSYTVIPLG